MGSGAGLNPAILKASYCSNNVAQLGEQIDGAMALGVWKRAKEDWDPQSFTEGPLCRAMGMRLEPAS